MNRMSGAIADKSATFTSLEDIRLRYLSLTRESFNTMREGDRGRQPTAGDFA